MQALALSGTRVIELAVLDIDPEAVGPQRGKSRWPAMHALLSDKFAQRSRHEWSLVFAHTDACVTPVLSLAEAATDAHLTERGVFIELDGVTQPTLAPRFSRTPPPIPSGPPRHAEVMAGLWLD
jgi:alpha-methylacyl-CoA racemase